VSEGKGKEVVRVERWEGRILLMWILIKNQLVAIMSVYGPQTGRGEADKLAFRDALETMMGRVEDGIMLCVAGDFNAHVGVRGIGEEECVGNFGWGTRNREGSELVELCLRNGMAVAGSFFKKRASHKITYRSGLHKTELDLLVVRKGQLWRVKDCKAVAGEHVTTQHKPIIFVIRLQKRNVMRELGQKVIKWWVCKDQVADDYKERVADSFNGLQEQVGSVEEEWGLFKLAFVGVAEQLCGRTTGKRGGSWKKSQMWWTKEVERAVKEKREVWKELEVIRDSGVQPDLALRHLCGQNKRAARRAVERTRGDVEDSIYRQLDEDGGRKLIFKMARDRKEEG